MAVLLPVRAMRKFWTFARKREKQESLMSMVTSAVLDVMLTLWKFARMNKMSGIP
jgi:hypothetical protein